MQRYHEGGEGRGQKCLRRLMLYSRDRKNDDDEGGDERETDSGMLD